MKRRKRIEGLSVHARLSLLRRGVLDPDEIADPVADFGTGNYIEAKPDVERLLDHPDPIVRYNALGTLAYEWGAAERVDRIVDILKHDQDSDCRRQAAGALGSLHRGVRDKGLAKTLANVVLDQAERDDVRVSAYTALLDILGIERTLQPNPLSIAVKDIDWQLVRNSSAT
ncbi:MAG: HEAT repeat domain-containing protein [Candidatus Acidiferrales bacterium]